MSVPTILPWVANELASMDPSSFSSVIEQTSGGGTNFDPAYCRCSMCFQPGGWALSPTWPVATTFWFHFRLTGGAALSSATNCNTCSFLRNGVEVARFVSTYGGSPNMVTWQMWTLQGGGLTLVNQVTLAYAPLSQFGIQIVGGGGGKVAFYSSGTLLYSTAANNAFDGVDQVQPRGIGVPFNGGAAFWTEIIADYVPHIQGRVKTFPIDTLSSVNNQWTGTVANVDKIVSDDSTFVSTPNALQNNSYYANGLNLGSLPIYSVHVAARAKCDATGPQNLKLLLRTSAANFLSTSAFALASGYQSCCYCWPLNPANAATWATSDAQAVEGGHQSET